MPPKVIRIPRVCQTCGKGFEETPWRVAKGYGLFCSRTCMYESKKRRQEHICERCGTSFEVRDDVARRGFGKFCSRTCFIGAKAIIHKCLVCDREFEAKPYRVKQGNARYCSRQCFYQDRACKWGHDTPRQPKTWRKQWFVTRKLIYDRDGGICQVCLKAIPYDQNYHCGHIIDRAVGGSDEPSNCVVMCRRCNCNKPYHRTERQYRKWIKERRAQLIGYA